MGKVIVGHFLLGRDATSRTPNRDLFRIVEDILRTSICESKEVLEMFPGFDFTPQDIWLDKFKSQL